MESEGEVIVGDDIYYDAAPQIAQLSDIGPEDHEVDKLATSVSGRQTPPAPGTGAMPTTSGVQNTPATGPAGGSKSNTDPDANKERTSPLDKTFEEEYRRQRLSPSRLAKANGHLELSPKALAKAQADAVTAQNKEAARDNVTRRLDMDTKLNQRPLVHGFSKQEAPARGLVPNPANHRSALRNNTREDKKGVHVGDHSVVSQRMVESKIMAINDGDVQTAWLEASKAVGLEDDHIVTLPAQGSYQVTDNFTMPSLNNAPTTHHTDITYNRFDNGQHMAEAFIIRGGKSVKIKDMDVGEVEGMCDPKNPAASLVNKVCASLATHGPIGQQGAGAVTSQLFMKTRVNDLAGFLIPGAIGVLQLEDHQTMNVPAGVVALPAGHVEYANIADPVGIAALAAHNSSGRIILPVNQFTEPERNAINIISSGLPMFFNNAGQGPAGENHHIAQHMGSPTYPLLWYGTGNIPANLQNAALPAAAELLAAIKSFAQYMGQPDAVTRAFTRALSIINGRLHRVARTLPGVYNPPAFDDTPMDRPIWARLPVFAPHPNAEEGDEERGVLVWQGNVATWIPEGELEARVADLIAADLVRRRAIYDAEVARANVAFLAANEYHETQYETCTFERGFTTVPIFTDFNWMWRTFAGVFSYVVVDPAMKHDTPIVGGASPCMLNRYSFVASSILSYGYFQSMQMFNVTGRALNGWANNAAAYATFSMQWTSLVRVQQASVLPLTRLALSACREFSDFLFSPKAFFQQSWCNSGHNVRAFDDRTAWAGLHPRVPHHGCPLAFGWLIRRMPSAWGLTIAPTTWNLTADLVNFGPDLGIHTDKGDKSYAERASSGKLYIYVAYGAIVLNAIRQFLHSDQIDPQFQRFDRGLEGTAVARHIVPDPLGAQYELIANTVLLNVGQIITFDWANLTFLSIVLTVGVSFTVAQFNIMRTSCGPDTLTCAGVFLNTEYVVAGMDVGLGALEEFGIYDLPDKTDADTLLN